ncbi:MAG: TetR/AcrR family transcriptional regulator, partial [Chrysiogenales bacterium]
MTKAPRDAVEIEKIRDAIIEAAVAIIHKSGFQMLTMRKIAARMGMSASNLYNYFANKDEIYITILIRGFRLLHDELIQVTEGEPDPLERAKRFISTYLAFGIQNYHYYEIMFSPALPKYADYADSPLEGLARVELEFSRKIIDMALGAIGRIMENEGNADRNEGIRRMIEIWSMLHGMISLRNSKLIEYVVADPDAIY